MSASYWRVLLTIGNKKGLTSDVSSTVKPDIVNNLYLPKSTTNIGQYGCLVLALRSEMAKPSCHKERTSRPGIQQRLIHST